MDHKEKYVNYWVLESQACTFERMNTRLLVVLALNTFVTVILFIKNLRR